MDASAATRLYGGASEVRADEDALSAALDGDELADITLEEMAELDSEVRGVENGEEQAR